MVPGQADRLLGEFGPRVVQYSATDGVPELRRWIASTYSTVLGREVAVDGEHHLRHPRRQLAARIGAAPSVGRGIAAG